MHYYLWVHNWENGLCYPAWHCKLEKSRSQWGSVLLITCSEKMGPVCTAWTQGFQVAFSFSFPLNYYLMLYQSVKSQYTDSRWTVVWEHIWDDSRLPWEERLWSPSSVQQLRISHLNHLCKEWTEPEMEEGWLKNSRLLWNLNKFGSVCSSSAINFYLLL